MADHLRSAFHGPSSVKSLVRPINSSGDIAMYRCRFGLKLPIHAPFWVVLGHIFPIWRHLLSWPPRRTLLGRKHVVGAIQCKNQCDGSTWARAQEKKYRTTKKSQKCYISPILGGSPHWTDSTQKLRDTWCPRRNYVCKVSNWHFRGLRFYRGSNFRYLPRDAMQARSLLSCSVRLSVRLSRSWITSKRINISSKFFHHRIATPF